MYMYCDWERDFVAELVLKFGDEEERIELVFETIAHEFEVAIGGDEADLLVGVVVIEFDTLVELDISEIDLLVGVAKLAGELIIQTQHALRHPRQQTLALDNPLNARLHHMSIRVLQYRNLLHYVQKYLVLPILYPLLPPRHRVAHRQRNLHKLTLFLYVLLCLYKLSKDLTLRRLRMSVVHHLVQQFIYYHEVIPNTIIFQIL